ncbi:MAG: hypothetical protein L3K14_02820 [Thermoplasmata archaeon]|nr:hypothetical protein [Thermoplasmata archaeon]
MAWGFVIGLAGLFVAWLGPILFQNDWNFPSVFPGLVVVGVGTVVVLDGIRRPGSIQDPGLSPKSRRRLQYGLTAGAVAVPVVLMLLWLGALPGLYYPSPISQVISVACPPTTAGTLVGPAFPGFPPGSHVTFRWTTQPALNVWIGVVQSSSTSSVGYLGYSSNGTSGSLSFVGNGGASWWNVGVADPQAVGCPWVDDVHLQVTYVLGL